jgi:predicted Co/Zn/Cd cation transporter (cation efflux family)
LREFGVAVGVLAGAGAYLFGGAGQAILAVSCALFLAVAALAPALLRVPFVLAMALTSPIGWVVSHLVLAAIFFALITPIGLLMRVLGRRAMDLEIDRAAESYWQEHSAPRDQREYLRQS